MGPSLVCSVYLYIFASADWFVLIFLPVCLLQGARALSTFGGRFTDPALSRLANFLPLQCLGAKADSTISTIPELLKSLDSGLLVIGKSVFFRQVFCMALLI